MSLDAPACKVIGGAIINFKGDAPEPKLSDFLGDNFGSSIQF